MHPSSSSSPAEPLADRCRYEYKAPRATTETDNAVYDWIRRKYELKEFLRPEGVIDTGSDDDEPVAPPQNTQYGSSGIQAVPVPAGAPQAYMSPPGGWQPAPVPGAAPPAQAPPSDFSMYGGAHQGVRVPPSSPP